jgi:hypothetical protein
MTNASSEELFLRKPFLLLAQLPRSPANTGGRAARLHEASMNNKNTVPKLELTSGLFAL